MSELGSTVFADIGESGSSSDKDDEDSSAATLAILEKGNFDRKKYEHKEVLELGKYYYSCVFKLAPMTFAFNGAMLAALHFIITNGDKGGRLLQLGELFFVGLLG